MRFIISVILYFCVIQLTYGIESKQTDNRAWVYVVSNGDNLWNITSKFLKKIDYYTDLQKINNIKYPKRISPGTVIRIPMQWLKHSPANARVTFQQGKNQYLRNKELHPLTLATRLVLGDEIRIGNDSSATIIFADNSEMVLFKDTIVAFDHLSIYGKTGMVDTRIRLVQGRVETNAKKNKGPGSRLDISTPSAISSVRGTKYRVSNSFDDISTVEVLEGNVSVAGDEPDEEISVTAGLGTRIEKGKAPTKPVKLLSPPKIITPATLFESMPIVAWEPILKAKRYNIQVSNTKSFKRILWQTISPDNSISIPNHLSDGEYFYRVTAIDSLGIEGIPADGQFALNLFPKAPAINNTPERFSSDVTSNSLSWVTLNQSSNESYLIEIAQDEDFSQSILKEQTNSAEFTLPDTLSFGEYYWRVSSIINNDKGPVSPTSKLNWTTRLSQPSCIVDQSSEVIDITWAKLQSNQHIAIQLSPDSKFNKVTKEYNFDSKTPHLNVSTDQELFVRCKVVLPNAKTESQWSEIQHIAQIDKGILSLFGFILLIILI